MRSVALAVTATLLATASASALSIQDSDIVSASLASVDDRHQSLEKTWTVSSAEPLHSLFVQLPGNVFVDYDPSLKASSSPSSSTTSSVVATIVVRGDSEELLEIFEVVPHSLGTPSHASNEDSVIVHLKNLDAAVQGHVLTQIYVADKSALHGLFTVGTHDVVVSEGVLTANDTAASIKLSAAGAGSLIVATQETFALDALQITATGSSSVHFSASSLHLSNSVELSLSGNGDIAVEAHDVHAKQLETNVSGSGGVFVQAEGVSVDGLTSGVAGSGSVAITNGIGTCTKQSVRIAGSGTVATDAIACQDTNVSIVGSGSAVVHSTETLSVVASTSGAVQYVNARPKTVTSAMDLSRYEPAARGTKSTDGRREDLPPRTATLLALALHAQPLADDPVVNSSVIHESDSAARSVPPVLFFVDCDGTESIAPVVGILMLALAAVGALVFKIRYQQRRRRRAYTSLA